MKTVEFTEIESIVLGLDKDARVKLVSVLLDSLEDYSDDFLEQEWINEAKRRKNEIEKGEVETISFSSVMKDLKVSVK